MKLEYIIDKTNPTFARAYAYHREAMNKANEITQKANELMKASDDLVNASWESMWRELQSLGLLKGKRLEDHSIHINDFGQLFINPIERPSIPKKIADVVDQLRAAGADVEVEEIKAQREH